MPFFCVLQVRLQVGLYIVYLMDWLSVVSREQMLVLRLEDHATNRKYTMHRVFDFLDLGEKQHIPDAWPDLKLIPRGGVILINTPQMPEDNLDGVIRNTRHWK